MKAVFTFDRKTGELDCFIRPGNGPIRRHDDGVIR